MNIDHIDTVVTNKREKRKKSIFCRIGLHNYSIYGWEGNSFKRFDMCSSCGKKKYQ